MRDSIWRPKEKRNVMKCLSDRPIYQWVRWWKKCHWLEARTHHISLRHRPHHSITQSLNNESLVSGTFNLILVENRSRGLLKHWDLWTVQMALNFSFFQLRFPKTFFVVFRFEIERKMFKRDTSPRLNFSDSVFFTTLYFHRSHLDFVTQKWKNVPFLAGFSS